MDWEVVSRIPGIWGHIQVCQLGLGGQVGVVRGLPVVGAGVYYTFKTFKCLLPMVHNLTFMLLGKSLILLIMAIWSTSGG